MTSVDYLESTLGALEVPIRFSRRPDPIPADLRLAWRLSALVLVLHRCRNNTATLQQLHVLTWAIRSAHNRETFARWINGDKRPDDVIVRYDPSLSRTVDLALGFGLVSRNDKGAIVLTIAGSELADRVEGESGTLAQEKAFLHRLPRRISQKYINDLVTWY
jgi:hypothetical protein